MVRPTSTEEDAAAVAATDADHGRAGGNHRVTRSRKQSSVDNSRMVDSAHGRGVPGSGSGGTSSNDDHHGRPLVNNESTAVEETNKAVLDSSNKQTRKRPSSQLATDNLPTVNETKPPHDHQSHSFRKKKSKVEPLACLSSHVKAEPKTDGSVKKEEPEKVLSYVKTEAKVEATAQKEEDTDGNYSSTIKSGLGRDFSHVKKEDQVDLSVAMEEVANGDDSTGDEMELAKKDSSINDDSKVEVVCLLDDDDDSVVELTGDEFARGAAKKDMGNGDGSYTPNQFGATAFTSDASTAVLYSESKLLVNKDSSRRKATRMADKKPLRQQGHAFPGPKVDPQDRKAPPGMGNGQAQQATARPSVTLLQDKHGSKEASVVNHDSKSLPQSSHSAHTNTNTNTNTNQASLPHSRNKQHQVYSSSLEIGHKTHANGSNGGKVVDHSSRNEDGDFGLVGNDKDGVLKSAARLFPVDGRISLAGSPSLQAAILKSSSAVASKGNGTARLPGPSFSPIRPSKDHKSTGVSGVPLVKVARKLPAASTAAATARISPNSGDSCNDAQVDHATAMALGNANTCTSCSSDRTDSSKEHDADTDLDDDDDALGATAFGQPDQTLQAATSARVESNLRIGYRQHTQEQEQLKQQVEGLQQENEGFRQQLEQLQDQNQTLLHQDQLQRKDIDHLQQKVQMLQQQLQMQQQINLLQQQQQPQPQQQPPPPHHQDDGEEEQLVEEEEDVQHNEEVEEDEELEEDDLDMDFSAHTKPLYFWQRAVQDALSDFRSVMDTTDMVSKIERATSDSIPAGTEITEKNGLCVMVMKKDRATAKVGTFSSSGEATVASHHIESFLNERDDVIVGHGAVKQKRGPHWKSQIRAGGKPRSIGYQFRTEDEAQFAYFIANEKISELSAARFASITETELDPFFAAVVLHVIQVYRHGHLVSE